MNKGGGRAIFPAMTQDRDRDLNMTLDGRFVSPPQPSVAPRLMFWAMVVAVVAGAAAVAALALWIALMLLPVALGAAAIGYLTFRYQMWRRGGSMTVFRRPGR